MASTPDQTRLSLLVMKVVNIQEAKTHLSRFLEEVLQGKEIVVAKAGKPIAKLVPYREQRPARVGGQLAGQIVEADDCWDPDDDPLGESADRPLYVADEDSSEIARVAEK